MKRLSTLFLVFLIVTLCLPFAGFTVPAAESEPTEGWVSRYAYDVSEGVTHTTTFFLGPQVFWDGSEWRELHSEDHYLTEGYYLIENSHITAKIYDWYTVFLDPDNQRVCVDDERWIVEVYGKDKWREVDLYGPTLTYSNNETHLTVTRTFDCPEGLFNVSYVVWRGSRLKHDVVFESRMEGSNQFRVSMKLTGIYSDKVRHSEGEETITTEKHIVSPYFFIGEDNNNLVFSEYLWSLGVSDEETGEWSSTVLKDVVFNTHAKGSKCDIIIGDYFLGQGESLVIDPDSNTWQVGASSDDCRYRTPPSEYWATGDIYFEAGGNGAASSAKWNSGGRFTGINIPQGSTISSAYLKIVCNLASSGTANTKISGEDADNASTFSTQSDYLGRDRTSAAVDWDPIAWTLGTEYTSPDIKTVIQEIVYRAGWASSNDLVLFWEDDGTPQVGENYRVGASWDDTTYEAPKLEVTWTVENSVTLNSPISGAQTSVTVDFNFSNTFYQPIQNASVYTNETGTWQLEETNSSAIIANQSNIISHVFSSSAEGIILWNVGVWNSTYEVFASSNATFTLDIPPRYQNVNSNATSIQPNGTILLYGQGYDGTGLDWAWLATNETGSWKNYTSPITLVWQEVHMVGTPVDSEGVCTDGTYFYVTEEHAIFKYNASWEHVTNRTGISLPTNYCLADCAYKDDKIYVACSNEVVGSPKHTRVYVYNPSDLSDANVFDAQNWKELAPDETYWANGIDWNGNYWWLSSLEYEDNKPVRVFKYNSTFDYQNEYHSLLPYTTDIQSGQGLAFYKVGAIEAWLFHTGSYPENKTINRYDSDWNFLGALNTLESNWEGLCFSTDYTQFLEVRNHDGYLDIYQIVDDHPPLDMNDTADTWTWSNFTWTNSSIGDGTQIQWRIYYNDTHGNVNATSIHTFMVASAQEQNFFGAVASQLAISSTQTWALNRYGTVNSQFSVISDAVASVLKDFFGSVAELFSVSSAKTVSFDLLHTVNPTFTAGSQKIVTFNLASSITQVFTVAGQHVASAAKNFFGAITQIFSVSSTKTMSFGIQPTINLLHAVQSEKTVTLNILSGFNFAFTVAGTSVASVIKNFFGSIGQTFTVATQRTWAFNLFHAINPAFTVDGFAEITWPLLNFYGAINQILGADGWTNLVPPVTPVTGVGIAVIALTLAMFAVILTLGVHRRRETQEPAF